MGKPAPPQKGHVLVSCGHFAIGSQVGWYWCSPLPFVRADGTTGNADWIVACEECHIRARITGQEPRYVEGLYDGLGIVQNPNAPRVEILATQGAVNG